MGQGVGRPNAAIAISVCPAHRPVMLRTHQRLWKRPLQAACSLLLLSGSGLAATPTDNTPSTPEQTALAEHLRSKGAVFYGAWWCSHCMHQKMLFGEPASSKLPYVECEREASERERCLAAKVRAYPTWDLNGERREGVQSLEQLASWSGWKQTSPSAVGH